MFFSKTVYVGEKNIKVNLVEVGEVNKGQSVTEIFIHGWGDSHKSWSEVMKFYSKTEGFEYRHILIVDLPGFGDSEKLEKRTKETSISDIYSSLFYTSFLGDLIHDFVGEGKVSLIGHSMGTVISRNFALDHPDIVEKLVMFGGTHCSSESTELKGSEKYIREMYEVKEEEIREFQKECFTNKQNPFYETICTESMKFSLAAFKLSYWNCLMNDNRKEDIKSIVAKTLLIHGSEDNYFKIDEDVVFLKENIKDCELVVMKGLGHCCNWDAPRESAEAIMNFL